MPENTDNLRSYAVLEQELLDLPRTWYPAAIRAVLAGAASHAVFCKGGLRNFVNTLIASLEKTDDA